MSSSRILIICLLAGCARAVWAQVIPVVQARSMAPGTAVTVQGIVTNGSELGQIRFLQDATAGIAAYPGNGSAPGFEAAISAGDSVEVTGILTDYNGLLEITPVTAFQVLKSQLPLPAPRSVSFADLSEDLESQLIEVECASFAGAGGIFSGPGTYSAHDPAGSSAVVYLRSGSPLLGAGIPEGPVRLKAILSQYGNFQLLPRTTDDFSQADCFHFIRKPDQGEIEPGQFQITWETNLPATAVVRFDTTPALSRTLIQATPETAHSVWIGNLRPATVYWLQVASVHQQDTIFSAIRPFITRSESSGRIKVYFNQGIDANAANGIQADGVTYEAVLTETLARIQAARQTVDVAMYSNNRSDITNALKQAQFRGVQVRYIAAAGADNPGLQPSPSFPVLYGNNTALMHDKFMVIDAGFADQAWVMSGSMNWTFGNMIQDYNNTLFIQDQSLARAYTLEFEEMWGSSGAQPNVSNSRFGSNKTDNTPHHFMIGGRPAESWFSPSDQVTNRISDAIKTADYQCSFAIFSFTKDEIGNAFVLDYKNGVWVRGLIENINDPGAEYGWLLSNGLPVYPHPADALLHHKYTVLDAGYPDSDPTVVTGSHNWTQSAESVNDENTLVIHDDTLAVLYQAEFERRWAENTTGTAAATMDSIRTYPNPATDVFYLENRDAGPWSGVVEVWSGAGQRIRTQPLEAVGRTGISMTGLPAGTYLIRIISSRGAAAFSIQTLPR